MTRQYVGTPTNVYRGWRIEYAHPPIPSRNCDWSATHPDFDGEGDNRQVWAASYEALTAEIDAWISENTTYGLIDPEQDRKDAIMEVVGTCNRIPGSTQWNAAEFMYDLMVSRFPKPSLRQENIMVSCNHCKPIKRAVAMDLIAAIYRKEGWQIGDRAGFNSRSARCSQIYDITADPRVNRYVAVRKECPRAKALNHEA